MNADLAVLRARYGELTPLDITPEGSRYAGTLPDGTPVIVVRLPSSVTRAIEDADAFAERLKQASALHDEEISRVVSWGCEDGVYHCGYVHTETQELDPGSHTSAEVAEIGARVARAVHAAHRSGVVHGAISTRQLRVTSDGLPRLQSFGIVSALIAGGMRPQAAYAEVCDDLYLSPEQQAGEPPTAQSDVYALGATLYELLTGKPPFGGRTTSYVMATVLPEEPTSGPTQTTTADIVIHALLRAIEREPEDRWPNAHALADALTAAIAPVTTAERRATTAGVSALRARFAAIFHGAWFPAGRSRE